MERISFKTNDGVNIIGDWMMPKDATQAVLLLHMMPANRGSFAPLSQALNEHSIATLAIDLRGHGESIIMKMPGATIEGKETQLDYTKFTDREHQASRLDVDSAMNFLKSKGFDEPAVSFVGASIGANLSLDALSRYKNSSMAALLSPGLDYRGVKTEPLLQNLSSSQKVLIYAATGDDHSAKSSEVLHAARSDSTTLKLFPGDDAHGTNLFKSHPEIISEIVAFLAEDGTK